MTAATLLVCLWLLPVPRGRAVEAPTIDEPMYQCSNCERKFNEAAIAKHEVLGTCLPALAEITCVGGWLEVLPCRGSFNCSLPPLAVVQAICRKVFSSQRKVFNSKAHRLEGEALKIAQEAERKEKRGGGKAGPGRETGRAAFTHAPSLGVVAVVVGAACRCVALP